ncbi:MAG: S1 family peptidase [Bifidobacteriaceae bacterium]|jgi:hypothetical protein|nr:S1 family peptidase [Bifidobacteriaceae bacterium]
MQNEHPKCRTGFHAATSTAAVLPLAVGPAAVSADHAVSSEVLAIDDSYGTGAALHESIEAPSVNTIELAKEYRAKAVALLGGRFVEFWLTESQDHYVVGILDLTPGEEAEFKAALATIAPTEVVKREISRGELEIAAAQVVDSVEATGVSPGAVSLNYERGTVNVSLPTVEAVSGAVDRIEANTNVETVTGSEALEATEPFDSSIISAEPAAVLTRTRALKTEDTRYSAPLRAGKSIKTTASNGVERQCTSGFLVKGAGGYYSLTAGHCGPAGSLVSTGSTASTSTVQGNLANNSFWGLDSGTSDVAIFYVPTGASITPSVYVNANSNRPVVAKTDVVPQYARGCINGAVSQTEKCGNVTSTAAVVDYVPSSSNPVDGINHHITGLIEITWDSGVGTTAGGDSGGPIYAVNADQTAIALGIHSGSRAILNSAGAVVSYQSLSTPISGALLRTGTSLAAVDRSPFGSIDLVSGGSGSVTVGGWIMDPDLCRTPTQVHVYVGGPGGGGGQGFAVNAANARPDVAAAYPNYGANHGFHQTLAIGLRGSVSVYIYGINIGGEPGVNP